MPKLCALIAFAVLVGCGSSSKPKPTPAPPVGDARTPAIKPPVPDKPKSLYDRLGGKDAIFAVADDFVNRTTTDPRIMFRFFNTDAPTLKRLLGEFVCNVTGGPCQYSGRDMGTAHAGMDLVDDEFTALVENLVATLDQFKVPEKEKNEILAALGPLKPQIVVAADKLKPIDDASLAKATKAIAAIKDKQAHDMLAAAIVAGKRGQRSYAEQLVTRAEMLVGDKQLAAIAPIFRKGAPPRLTTQPKQAAKDAAPQPATVGRSEDDEPVAKKPPQFGSLKGQMMLDGKPLAGFSVVMMWPKTGGYKKRIPKLRVIEQRDKQFAPHVMAVPVGSTVQFPNFDGIFHNVFSLSKGKAFDLGMYKQGDQREVKFEKAGIIRLGCNIHANMSAYLIVVDAPAYAVAEQDGSFVFRVLAPGTWRVQGWSERSAAPVDTEVTIKAGDNTVSIDLKGGATQGPSEDKFGASRQVVQK